MTTLPPRKRRIFTRRRRWSWAGAAARLAVVAVAILAVQGGGDEAVSEALDAATDALAGALHPASLGLPGESRGEHAGATAVHPLHTSRD